LRARRCVITGWYRRRRFADSQLDPDADTRVLYGIRHPIELAGEATAIPVIGAGLSGRETAMSLMRSGLAVVLFAQRASEQVKDFVQHPLTTATSSQAIVARDVRIARGGIRFRSELDHDYTSMSCRRAVACLGQELDLETCGVLVEFGALGEEEVVRLAGARTSDDVARQLGIRDPATVRRMIAPERPDPRAPRPSSGRRRAPRRRVTRRGGHVAPIR
jgi:hypothetical protein